MANAEECVIHRMICPFTKEEEEFYLFMKSLVGNNAIYNRWKIDPMVFAIVNDLDACRFNIIKYIMRHKEKGGLDSIKKARRYLDLYTIKEYGQEALDEINKEYVK